MSNWCDWGRDRNPAESEMFDGAEVIDTTPSTEEERAEEEEEERAEREIPWVPMQ
jgi:hypothetical protein